jgi:hypothetical protein
LPEDRLAHIVNGSVCRATGGLGAEQRSHARLAT